MLIAANAAKTKSPEASVDELVLDPNDTVTNLVPKLYRPNAMAAKLAKTKQKAAEVKAASTKGSPGFSKFLPTTSTAKSGKTG